MKQMKDWNLCGLSIALFKKGDRHIPVRQFSSPHMGGQAKSARRKIYSAIPADDVRGRFS